MRYSWLPLGRGSATISGSMPNAEDRILRELLQPTELKEREACWSGTVGMHPAPELAAGAQ